jgi:hypothetical protein
MIVEVVDDTPCGVAVRVGRPSMTKSGTEQLVVRQHERHLCRVACSLRMGEQGAEQVALARSVGDGAGRVEATIVDCSRGGLGLESRVFLPRGSRMLVRIGTPEGGAELSVRVQRATMTDRTPTYYLGVSFAGSGPEHERAVAATLELARAAAPAAKGGA